MMNILKVKPTSSGYTVEYDNGVIMSVPNATGNRHYNEIQEWLNDDNTLDPEFTLDEIKENKRNEIRQAFNTESVADVQIDAVTYHGGYESNQKLDAGVRLAEQNAQTDITFFDVNNIGHLLTIAEAKLVTTGIGVKYQNDFNKKQGLMVNIDDAIDEATVALITW